MKGKSLVCVLAFALIAFFRPAGAQQPLTTNEGRDGVALWVAASDIDLLGAHIADWLPSLGLVEVASTRAEPRKDDGPSYLQAAASYLDLAGPWSIANGIVLRAGFNKGPDRDAPITPGAPPAVTANRLSQVYEMLGRHLFVTFSASF